MKLTAEEKRWILEYAKQHRDKLLEVLDNPNVYGAIKATASRDMESLEKLFAKLYGTPSSIPQTEVYVIPEEI